MPNISSSEVYFRRQLTFYIFNVNILSTGQSFMYTYDQTIAKKGSNDVASMLLHFIENYLDKSVTHLNIFADSCGGQNKNHTMIQFLHYVTSELQVFEKVVVTYPVRGHSYMEPDKNMALISKTAKAETPADWREVIEGARAKPTPFVVVTYDQAIFKNWGESLQSKGYKKKLAFEIRPIKQLRFVNLKLRTMEHRMSYNGAFYTAVVRLTDQEIEKEKQKRLKKKLEPLPQLEEPQLSYNALIPLSKEKANDLQVLMRYCENEGSKEFYSNLLTATSNVF